MLTGGRRQPTSIDTAGESNMSIPNENDFRAKAIRRIKRKRDFQGHVIVFLIVNTGLWLIWAKVPPVLRRLFYLDSAGSGWSLSGWCSSCSV